MTTEAVTPKHKCLIPNCQELTTTRLCHDHWYRLPLVLRHRWWQETSYGKNEPNAELIATLKAFHDNPADWRPASE